MSLKVRLPTICVLGLFFIVAIKGAGSSLNSTETKLRFIENNGKQAHPDSRPSEFTENEINAYFASGEVKLPAGVRSVAFRGTPGRVTANCTVDFDQLAAGARDTNPLLSLFSGVHEVVVIADARGVGGRGMVEVQSVTLDGENVPRFILGIFVKSFLQPKYPDVGLESRFDLPDKIDSAVVGEHQLVLIQR